VAGFDLGTHDLALDGAFSLDFESPCELDAEVPFFPGADDHCQLRRQTHWHYGKFWKIFNEIDFGTPAHDEIRSGSGAHYTSE